MVFSSKRIIRLVVVIAILIVFVATTFLCAKILINSLRQDMSNESGAMFGFWYAGIIYTIVEYIWMIIVEISFIFSVKSLFISKSAFSIIIDIVLITTTIINVAFFFLFHSSLLINAKSSILSTLIIMRVTCAVIWIIDRIVRAMRNFIIQS